MTLPPPAILYTQDAELVRRVKAFLRMMGQVRHVADAGPPRRRLATNRAVRSPHRSPRERKPRADRPDPKDWPEILIIALGVPHSEPLREAEESGIYAAEDLRLDRRHFQALVGRAFDLLRVMQENRELREHRDANQSLRRHRRRASI